ncbi:hypothetical protein Ccrd_011684 [Cynara cardunculus var. scolymus]|uniref:Protein kinase domain-containing protein n=1 Tax=Cynara cardunculus var. scolymus TaxID=59895 RepID=A0A118K621_CYNCS|nr:hypothetical protein Ccrd_011684 [Cynara cardunculus var. scolymus]
MRYGSLERENTPYSSSLTALLYYSESTQLVDRRFRESLIVRGGCVVVEFLFDSSTLIFSADKIPKGFTFVNLRNMCLGGTLAPDLGNLAHLKSIILRNNSFHGTIPKKIGQMKKLKVLDLGYNNFGGPLPSDLRNSQLPKILSLDNNELLDSISPEVQQLTLLPEAEQRSYRNRREMTGNIAQTGVESHRKLLVTVDDNISVPPVTVLLPPPLPSPPPISPSPSPSKFSPTGVPKLKRSELEAACEDFSNVIGSTSFGTIYKGTLSSGVEIAVASVAAPSAKDWSKHLESLFRKRIDMLSKVNHKNFVNLLGYCEEDMPFTRMIAFEYAPNGTLFEHLHSDTRSRAFGLGNEDENCNGDGILS